MTTSGLYGTVVGATTTAPSAVIAPGVEVKWALAALRDAPSLPPQYRRRRSTATMPTDADPDATSGADAGDEPEIRILSSRRLSPRRSY